LAILQERIQLSRGSDGTGRCPQRQEGNHDPTNDEQKKPVLA
jgi:hypothetical protein